MTIKMHSARLLCSTAAITLLFAAAQNARAAEVVSPGADGGRIETVVVTGSRASEIKKQAPNVLDVAPLEQIRSLPDANVAEVLQRLPGVSMESDSGQGRFVNIRGLDADLNGTTYDGVRLTASNPATPQGGARAVAFDAFPSGILGGVEVMKSLNADMDAEGLGGVVNILPRTIPTGEDHVFDASIGSGVESLSGSAVWKGDITVGKRFGLTPGDDRFSFLLSYGYDEDRRAVDDIEEDYINDPTASPAGATAFQASKAFDDVQYRYYQYHRVRQGLGGTLTFSPDDNTNFYIRGLHAGYTEYANKHEFVLANLADNIVGVDNTTGGFTSAAATAHNSMINTKESLGNNLLEFGGDTLIANTVKMDARVSWTQGYDAFPYAINAKFTDPNTFPLAYNNANPNDPSYHSLGGADLTNPATYSQFSGSNSASHNTDTEYAGAVNFSMPLEFAGDDGVLKFGSSVRERTRKSQAYAADLINNGTSLTAFTGGPDKIYYGNRYDIGPQPDFRQLLSIPQTALTADPSSYENDNENVYAGYAQYSASFGALDVIGGLRIEATGGTYRANAIDENNNITSSTANHNYINLFPDISFKYQASDQLQFRAAFTTAIARPGFNQISAAKSIDYTNDVVSQGNPDLKPTLGRNIDLTASYFLPEDGIASVGLFYKSFSDYIIPTAQFNVKNYPDPRLTGQNVELDSYQNIGSARAEGVEIAYNQQFVFLPGPFSGVGFDGNLTYVGSSGEIRAGEKHALPQTSPFNYNAGLYYTQGPIYMKIAASYVSRNLWAVGSSDDTDLYSQPRFRLDFGGTYEITNQVQLYLDVKNLTNTKLEFTQTASQAYPVQREYYNADYLFGVRVKL